MLVVVDMNLGNRGSVLDALQHIGADPLVAESEKDIAAASRLIIPGVGTFGGAMDSLRGKGFIEPLQKAVCERGVPVLGICLGMQLLMGSGEEFGFHAGLNFIAGRVAPLDKSVGLVPNMGWHTVSGTGNASPLFADIDGAAFYFAHSYHVLCDTAADLAAGMVWSGTTLTAAICKNNIMGVQFHPEKSQSAGLDLLHKFLCL